MSVRYVEGDLLRDEAEALVNPVNCVGVMGKGLALRFKRAWPEYFTAYRMACEAGSLKPGTLLVLDRGHGQAPRYLVCFPTKRHWRDPSRLEDIDAGLSALAREVVARGIRSIAVPALGCGLGGLGWPDVRERIEAALGPLAGVDVRVYGPGEPEVAEDVPPPRRYYAGIGSRETPADVLATMTEIARRLRARGFVLRSGGARGADQAFAAGAGEDAEIFLPWPGFEGQQSRFCPPTTAAYELAGQHHPAWAQLSDGARRLQARNSHQVLGWGLDDPVEFVVCWTPDGKGAGGTGQAIRIAAATGIPVFDLGGDRRSALAALAQVVRGLSGAAESSSH